MVEATIYFSEGDSKDTLRSMQRTLAKIEIEYKMGQGIISENYQPIVSLEGKLFDNERSLFTYLQHREK